MSLATEYDFNRYVNEIAILNGLTEQQEQYLNMYAAQNGYDCGDECWQVAINTVDMVIDQGQLLAVANNEL